MRSRLLLNIALFIVAVGLTVFLISTGDEEAETPAIQLTDIDPAGITEIAITRRDRGEILFRKEGGAWLMTSPLAHRANVFRMNALLKLPGTRSYARFSAVEAELARFRLEAPEVIVSFNDTPIMFGDTNPLSGQRYVLAGDTVHLINDSFYLQLMAPAASFLDTRLLPESAEITALSLPGYEISKPGGTWTIEPPEGISADQITAIINAWRDAEAITLREYEAAEDHGTIRIELAGGDTIRYLMTGAPPGLILANPDLGLQYHLSDYDAERLFPKKGDEDSGLSDE